MNIYIGNLAWSATNQELTDMFSAYGEVKSAKIVVDKMSNRSKGFAFVEMESGGSEAIEALNGRDFKGRNLVVNEAQPREERPRSNNRYGGGNRY